MIPRAFLSRTLVLLSYPVYTLSAALGKLNSFTNYYCSEASVVNPIISLPINTCLVSPNAYSFSVQTLPPCSKGTAILTLYDDTSCANPLEKNEFNTEDNCYNDSGGGHIFAIQFTCEEVDKGSVATSTTTATFGTSLIPIATDTSPSSSGSKSTKPSSNAAVPTSSSSSSGSSSPSSSPDSTSPPSSTSAANNNSPSNNNNGNSGGLSRSAQIGLGVGIPTAAVIVALLAWWFPCKKGRRPAEDHHQHNSGGGLPMTNNHQGHNWMGQANHPGVAQEMPADRKWAYR